MSRIDFNVIITTLFSVGAGGLIGFFSARRISVLNNRQIANRNLRKVFAPALAIIKIGWHPGVGHADQFLKDEIVKQAAAVEEFRFFVHEKNQEEYQKAWDDYQEAVSQITGCGDFNSSIYLNYINKILIASR